VHCGLVDRRTVPAASRPRKSVRAPKPPPFPPSGRRILAALAAGQSAPEELAAWGDARLKCTRQQMQDALAGPVSPVLGKLLRMLLEQVEFLDRQMEELTRLTVETMRGWQDAVARLAEIPGIRTLAAQQILAETGPPAAAFPSAGPFVSWRGACPGREESAGVNQSGRCPKGNRYLRRSLCQAAQAAVRTKNSHFQTVFRRLVPRLGYTKAIRAIVRHLAEVIWKILHTGAHMKNAAPPAPRRPSSAASRDSPRNCGTLAIPSRSDPRPSQETRHDFRRSRHGPVGHL
jgi:hypothetical protein